MWFQALKWSLLGSGGAALSFSFFIGDLASYQLGGCHWFLLSLVAGDCFSPPCCLFKKKRNNNNNGSVSKFYARGSLFLLSPGKPLYLNLKEE